MNAPAHLLEHNLLVIQQVSSVVSDKYAIMDGNGNAVGRIVDIPDCFSAAFGTSRFDVLDANGSVVLRMGDQFDFDFDFSHVRMRDMPTYVLALSNGAFLASIVDRTGFAGRKLAICPAAGPPLNVRGKTFDRDFEATFGDGGAARPGVGTGPPQSAPGSPGPGRSSDPGSRQNSIISLRSGRSKMSTGCLQR